MRLVILDRDEREAANARIFACARNAGASRLVLHHGDHEVRLERAKAHAGGDVDEPGALLRGEDRGASVLEMLLDAVREDRLEVVVRQKAGADGGLAVGARNTVVVARDKRRGPPGESEC